MDIFVDFGLRVSNDCECIPTVFVYLPAQMCPILRFKPLWGAVKPSRKWLVKISNDVAHKTAFCTVDLAYYRIYLTDRKSSLKIVCSFFFSLRLSKLQ